jgi:hypothetical protein
MHMTTIAANGIDRRKENSLIRRYHLPHSPVLFLMSSYVSTL